VRRLG
jgi:hypothetical protein